MPRVAAALAAGLLFGAGLTISGMIDPRVVLAFLDVAAIVDGGWDPRLAVVMAGALVTVAVGYQIVFRRRAPLFAGTFAVPRRRDVDARLIGGAMLFGVGWGLVGYCPGPAIAGLGLGVGATAAFFAAMLAGMFVHRLLPQRSAEGAGPPGIAHER